MVKNTGQEVKMQIETILKVKRSGRSTYLKIPSDVAGNYLLKPGDLIRVELKTLIRSDEERQEQEVPT